MRISDWSSDVCSSDLPDGFLIAKSKLSSSSTSSAIKSGDRGLARRSRTSPTAWSTETLDVSIFLRIGNLPNPTFLPTGSDFIECPKAEPSRSEEHTSELQVTNAHLVCRLLLEKKKKHKN